MISNNARVYSVRELTNEIAGVIEGSMTLRSVCVRGEISDYKKKPSKRGDNYLYFTLKDNASSLPCVMFEDVDSTVERFEQGGLWLGNGVSVVCEGAIGVYAPFGKYQLTCYAVFPDGVGASAAALKALKKRLNDEGLFAQKRPLPEFPKKIAVVTSATGAAVRDIINVISRRYPLTELCVIPAFVQGVNAVPSLVGGINRAQGTGAELIILGRGGGSSEDLDCFNSEALARAIFASGIPTISAVGHETDTTIADLAADLRAPTPSAAAELAVPDISELKGFIEALGSRTAQAMARKLAQCESMLSSLAKDVQLNSPRGRIAAWSSRLESVEARLRNRIHQRLERSEHALNIAVNTINSVNPLAVLSRGYSVAAKDGKAVKSSSELNVGDVIDIRLDKGEVSAEVKMIKE